jgi:hypothetical protein
MCSKCGSTVLEGVKSLSFAKDDPDFLKLVDDWLAKEKSTGDLQHVLEAALHQK